jgi:DNA-binding response OmpR family regulator
MSATTRRRPRALLLETDPACTRLLRHALERRGFEVLSAGDGARGLTLLIDQLLDLDVLVLDLDLPVRDGWSLLHLVRGRGGERELGIVVVGAGMDRARRAQLQLLGADAVVERSAGADASADAVAEVAASRALSERAACA